MHSANAPRPVLIKHIKTKMAEFNQKYNNKSQCHILSKCFIIIKSNVQILHYHCHLDGIEMLGQFSVIYLDDSNITISITI